MKVAMFEGLAKRSAKSSRACRSGFHASCVKNRASKKGGSTAAQKALARASRACKGKKASAFRKCVKSKFKK